MDLLSSSLTRKAGLKIGPLALEVLCKHYFERVKHANGPKLLQDELLYDEAFNIVKAFLEVSTMHTVEEVQSFFNTRTPAPPWMLAVRLVIPMSCCDDAATALIKALGGAEVAKRTVGGTKWWQVRGVNGVDAQWIVAKKDWREAKKRYKQRDSMAKNVTVENPEGEAVEPAYEPEMDEMRCILYSHGGGYFFGSTDQERYSIQRHARKINGRVFAVNYRLAPQYPFPCAIQDLLAAYLFLIRPPSGAMHRPVKPEHIIVAGDSAGGGVSLALLQVIRDAGLPMPAGGVLISPWCDLSHSFPSIHLNTPTDIIPPFGLSMQKPSTLWPPPNEELTTKVHAGLRSKIREAVKFKGAEPKFDRRGSQSTIRGEAPTPKAPEIPPPASPGGDVSLEVGATVPLPSTDAHDQGVELVTESGETLAVSDQIHLYAPNGLISHPLISPALSYLGGLPPLLFIASDKEVLRDEIIYSAHKAAYPDRFPVKPQSRALYPALEGIEERYKPTSVHLQVYDDTAHILPVVFPFCTPAKFCYRAIATFCKQVTDSMPTAPAAPPSPVSPVGLGRALSFGSRQRPKSSSGAPSSCPVSIAGPSASRPKMDRVRTTDDGLPLKGKTSMRRSLSMNLSRAASALRRSPPPPPVPAPVRDVAVESEHLEPVIEVQAPTPRVVMYVPNGTPVERTESPSETGSSRLSASPPPPPPPSQSQDSDAVDGSPPRQSMLRPSSKDDVAGPRFRINPPPLSTTSQRCAGDSIVYSDTDEFPSYTKGMIRERVSTQGVVRQLEPEAELDAMHMPHEKIGELSELALRRYLDGKAKFDSKFSSQIKTIEKHRKRHLEHARKDTVRNMTQLERYLSQEEKAKNKEKKDSSTAETMIKEAPGSWNWAWALDGDERPPPSSIASRRDTSEARRLARIADQSIFQEEHSLSANNLWSVMVNFLTVAPEKGKEKRKEGDGDGAVEVPVVDGHAGKEEVSPSATKRQSRFSKFFA